MIGKVLPVKTKYCLYSSIEILVSGDKLNSLHRDESGDDVVMSFIRSQMTNNTYTSGISNGLGLEHHKTEYAIYSYDLCKDSGGNKSFYYPHLRTGMMDFKVCEM